MHDMNDAAPQRDNEPIPDGSFVKLIMHIRPGKNSIQGMDPMDEGLFHASQSSDAMMLDCEFTVMEGQHKARKLWQMFTIAGGKTDEKGQSKGWLISKSTIRAIIESATGVDPEDMSDRAKGMRVFQAFKQLDGIEFYAKLKIEPGTSYQDEFHNTKQYPAKNLIDRVLTVKDPEYAALRSGQDVPPKGHGTATAPHAANGATAAGAPAWAKSAGTAAPAAVAGKPAWAAPATAAAAGPVVSLAVATPQAPKGPAWLNS